VVDKQAVRQSWYGLALNPKQDHVWWAGGGAATLHTFDLKDGKLTRTSPAEPDPKTLSKEELDRQKKEVSFKSGVLLDGETLYSLDINAGTLSTVNPADGKPTKTVPCGRRPYDVVRGRDGVLLYVSDWAGKVVLAVDPKELRVVARITVGEHPNQMAVHPKDDRLFVACASSNCVSVIDTQRGIVTETIMTSLFPKAPKGTTPDALALAPDGKALYIAKGEKHNLGGCQLRRGGKEQEEGFFPDGGAPPLHKKTAGGKTFLGGKKRGEPRARTHTPFYPPPPPPVPLVLEQLW